jgi:hypothetical protein
MSDLSENTDKEDADMENLSDEESSFYEQTSAEISRIAKKSRKHRIRTSTSSVAQTPISLKSGPFPMKYAEILQVHPKYNRSRASVLALISIPDSDIR